ncbi:hypothetical protein GA0115234_10549 [Streptomyces sp. DvalAA-43]|nr:hypothetical protein GA0115234_10549 [Streptomyces sp. DvalAA-43]
MSQTATPGSEFTDLAQLDDLVTVLGAPPAFGLPRRPDAGEPAGSIGAVCWGARERGLLRAPAVGPFPGNRAMTTKDSEPR